MDEENGEEPPSTLAEYMERVEEEELVRSLPFSDLLVGLLGSRFAELSACLSEFFFVPYIFF